MQLLHTGTGRIQRQVISLLRRVLPHIHPEKFAGLLGVSSLPPKDFGILAAAARAGSSGSDQWQSADNSNCDPVHKQGILDVFLSCIAKALSLQVYLIFSLGVKEETQDLVESTDRYLKHTCVIISNRVIVPGQSVQVCCKP